MIKLLSRFIGIIFLLVICYQIPNSAHAQTSGYTPGRLLDNVLDQYGNTYDIAALAIDDTLRGRFTGSIRPNVASTVSAGYFKLYLEEGCGMENYASDSIHSARLAAVSQVLTDLSAFIYSPCSSTGQKINIWVRDLHFFH